MREPVKHVVELEDVDADVWGDPPFVRRVTVTRAGTALGSAGAVWGEIILRGDADELQTLPEGVPVFLLVAPLVDGIGREDAKAHAKVGTPKKAARVVLSECVDLLRMAGFRHRTGGEVLTPLLEDVPRFLGHLLAGQQPPGLGQVRLDEYGALLALRETVRASIATWDEPDAADAWLGRLRDALAHCDAEQDPTVRALREAGASEREGLPISAKPGESVSRTIRAGELPAQVLVAIGRTGESTTFGVGGTGQDGGELDMLRDLREAVATLLDTGALIGNTSPEAERVWSTVGAAMKVKRDGRRTRAVARQGGAGGSGGQIVTDREPPPGTTERRTRTGMLEVSVPVADTDTDANGDQWSSGPLGDAARALLVAKPREVLTRSDEVRQAPVGGKEYTMVIPPELAELVAPPDQHDPAADYVEREILGCTVHGTPADVDRFGLVVERMDAIDKADAALETATEGLYAWARQLLDLPGQLTDNDRWRAGLRAVTRLEIARVRVRPPPEDGRLGAPEGGMPELEEEDPEVVTVTRRGLTAQIVAPGTGVRARRGMLRDVPAVTLADLRAVQETLDRGDHSEAKHRLASAVRRLEADQPDEEIGAKATGEITGGWTDDAAPAFQVDRGALDQHIAQAFGVPVETVREFRTATASGKSLGEALPVNLDLLATHVVAVEEGPHADAMHEAMVKARREHRAKQLAPWEELRAEHEDADGYTYDPAECVGLYQGDRVIAIVRTGSGSYDQGHVFDASGHATYSMEIGEDEGYDADDPYMTATRTACETLMREHWEELGLPDPGAAPVAG